MSEPLAKRPKEQKPLTKAQKRARAKRMLHTFETRFKRRELDHWLREARKVMHEALRDGEQTSYWVYYENCMVQDNRLHREIKLVEVPRALLNRLQDLNPGSEGTATELTVRTDAMGFIPENQRPAIDAFIAHAQSPNTATRTREELAHEGVVTDFYLTICYEPF